MLAIAALCRRDILRFLRQRSRLVGALVTPVVFWFVIGSGLGQSFRGPAGVALDGGYLEYYFPGTLALIVLFTAVFSTISIVEDRQEGFLQGVLASPAPRAAIVLGKALGGTALGTLQALPFLLLAPFAGVPLQITGALLTLAVLALLGLGLSGLGVLIAWRLASTQGFHAIMNLLLVPMWLVSGAVFPAEGAAGWVRAVMRVNPMTYGVAAARDALYGAWSWATVGPQVAVLVAFAGAMLVLATAAASRPLQGPAAN